MQAFSCKTKILQGDSGQLLRSLQSKALLLVADPYFVETGIARTLMAASGAEKTRLFSEISPDPTVELAAKGTAAMKAFQPDTVVALGGGSAIDCAKAMVCFYPEKTRLVAIPTTSGSGSEVTDFSVLTYGNVKHPLIDSKICPQVAILDESLLTRLPQALIADAGFDVLSHALEALVAQNAGPITDALAADAFRVAYAHLSASYHGDLSVRGKLHTASTMAGMAFSQAGLGLCHAMAHCLGGMYHIPHGRLNAILLPAVIGCNGLVAGDKYAKAARCAGISGAADSVAVRNLRNGLVRLRKELGLPETLRQAGVSPRQVRQQADTIVKTVLEDPCCRTNPLPVEGFMIRKLLEETIGHD